LQANFSTPLLEPRPAVRILVRSGLLRQRVLLAELVAKAVWPQLERAAQAEQVVLPVQPEVAAAELVAKAV
jgi:hypothetical protein